MQADDLIIFTADHGNDLTTPSGQTVAEFFGVGPLAAGRSFLREVWNG